MKNWSKEQLDRYASLKKAHLNSSWAETINACCNDAHVISSSKGSAIPAEISKELASFYSEIEKMKANYGCEYVFSPSQLTGINVEMRKMNEDGLYMNFDSMIIFGKMGNGDYLFSPLVAKGNVRNDVFLWDHETDSRIWVASGIKDMFFRLSSSMIG